MTNTRKHPTYAPLPPGQLELSDRGVRLRPLPPAQHERNKPCTVTDCETPRRSRGLCRKHFDRARRMTANQQRRADRAHGDPR